LVAADRLIIAGAQLAEQREESLVLLATCQIVHNILYNLHIDLLVE
jgi:hypothetical protein